MKIGLALMKNVLQPLAKSVLKPLELMAASSAVDTGIHKKILVSDETGNNNISHIKQRNGKYEPN